MSSHDAYSTITRRIAEFIGRSSGQDARVEGGSRDLDEEFNRLALELFQLQFETNAPFRALCEARGKLPGMVGDWTQVPPMPAAAFKERAVTSLAEEERRHVFQSSGTTEQTPSRHFHDDESMELYESSLKPWFARNVGSGASGLQFALLTPGVVEAPHSSLVHMFDVVSREFGDGKPAWLGFMNSEGRWDLDAEAAVSFLTEVQGGRRPIILLGTAFLFVHLMDALIDRGLCLELPKGSGIMETGGYKRQSREMPREELHRLVAQRLGVAPVDIVREYGMSELSSQAYACGASAFHFPPWARARIVSPESGREVSEGETGLIRIHDLANVRSVASLQTEDLGVRRGDGFELLGRAALAEPRGCSRMSL